MTVEVIFAMGMDGTGPKKYTFTESHCLLAANGPLTATDADVQALANARIALCGNNAYMIGTRASVVGVYRDSRVLNASDSQSGLTQYGGSPGSTGVQQSDQPNACLQLRLNANDIQRSTLYLAGVPDALLSTNPSGPNYGAAPAWLNNFNIWKTLITGGKWGFKARQNPPAIPPVQIIGWTNEIASPFRLVCSVPNANAFGNVGDVVQVRRVRMAVPRAPKPVGQWRVVAITAGPTATAYTLANSQGFDSSQILTYGTIEPVSYVYPAYAQVQVMGQTTRKRGASWSRPRGRSSARRRSLV